MGTPSPDPLAVTDPVQGSLELTGFVEEHLPGLLAALLLSALFIGGWILLIGGAIFSSGAAFASTGAPRALAQVFFFSCLLWLAVAAVGLLLHAALFFRAFAAGHAAVGRARLAEAAVGEGPAALPPVERPAEPVAAVFGLARGPSAYAGRTAVLMRALAYLFLILVITVGNDAVRTLQEGRGAFLGDSPGAGGVDGVLFAVGVAALAALALAVPHLRWVALRLDAIEEVEDAGTVRIPAGRDPLHRFIAHLREDVRYRVLLDQIPEAGMVGAKLAGASGERHQFDLHIHLTWRGALDRGFALYLRQFSQPPSLDEVEAFERAVADVSKKTRVPPDRIVLLFSPEAEAGFVGDIDDDVYERLTERHLTGRAGGRRYTCALELVTEQPDSTYEFIPYKAMGRR